MDRSRLPERTFSLSDRSRQRSASPERNLASPLQGTLLSQAPRELRSVISQQGQLLSNALEGPITRDEAIWLSRTRNNIAIGYKEVDGYLMECWRLGSLLKMGISSTEDTLFVTVGEKILPEGHVMLQHARERAGRSADMNRSIVGISLSPPFTSLIQNGAREADRLDVKSIFMILKRRYTEYGFRDAVHRARERTMRYLDDFVGNAFSSIGVTVYLLVCAVNMELITAVSGREIGNILSADSTKMRYEKILESLQCIC